MRTQPKFWTRRGLISLLLLPCALLYRFGSTLHRKLTTAQSLPIPVISIGNITVGGAGKTPTTIALVKLLQDMGHTPHILTRGYGATIHAPIHVDTHKHSANEVGDEALLLAKHAPTWAYSHRMVSGHAAINAGATIIVCDDALQHHGLKKDISLLVIDGGYGVGNGMILPAGPLRETLKSASNRCNGVILIGEDIHSLQRSISLPVFKATIAPRGDIAWLKNTPVIAFAGIARPQKFYDTLRALGAHIIATHDFPDHHVLDERTLQHLGSGGMLVTTEKDWVRLPTMWQSRIRYLPIELHMEDSAALTSWLREKLNA